MKVRYEFVNGEISEIEVDDNLGELLVDFDRQEYNNDHKETRRHTSLDGMEYEGEAFLSPENTEEQVLKRADMACLLRPWRPLPRPSGSWCAESILKTKALLLWPAPKECMSPPFVSGFGGFIKN